MFGRIERTDTEKLIPMTASPAIRTDFFQRLTAIASDDAPSSFELAKLKKEANSVMRDAPSLANSILGSIASLEGDRDETVRRFTTALRLEPSNRDLFHNYLVALRTLNVGEDLPGLIAKISPETTGMPEMVVETAVALQDAGWIRDSRDLISRLASDKESSELVNKFESYGFGAAQTEEICRLLERSSVEDRDLVALISRARQVVKSRGKRIPVQQCSLVEDGATGDWCALWQFKVIASSECAFELEMEVIDSLTSMEFAPYDDGKLAFMVSAMPREMWAEKVSAD